MVYSLRVRGLSTELDSFKSSVVEVMMGCAWGNYEIVRCARCRANIYSKTPIASLDRGTDKDKF